MSDSESRCRFLKLHTINFALLSLSSNLFLVFSQLVLRKHQLLDLVEKMLHASKRISDVNCFVKMDGAEFRKMDVIP